MKILDRCKGTLIVLMILTVDLLPVAVKSQAPAPARPLVIQGGTLIDATGRPPLQDVVIVIEGERIKAVGKRGDVAIPKGSRIIDVKGKTILPGLIDGHRHLLDFVGELYLHLGITTCPDITQNDDDWTKAQRDGHQFRQDPRAAHMVDRYPAGRSAAGLGAQGRERPPRQKCRRSARGRATKERDGTRYRQVQ